MRCDSHKADSRGLCPSNYEDPEELSRDTFPSGYRSITTTYLGIEPNQKFSVAIRVIAAGVPHQPASSAARNAQRQPYHSTDEQHSSTDTALDFLRGPVRLLGIQRDILAETEVLM